MQQTTQPTQRISEILSDYARGLDKPRVTLGDLSNVLGERAFGFLMLVLGLPNVIALAAIPGFSTVTGVPIILVAGQMMFGMKKPWLPEFVNKRSLASEDFRRFVEKAKPFLDRLERFLRPRLRWLTDGGITDRLLGAHCAVMAIVLSLPIPFGNLLPALSICFVALGLIERDGGFVLAGLALGVATFIFLLFLAAITAALIGAFLYLYNQL